RQDAFEKIADRLQPLGGALLQSTDSDVARRIAVELDAGAVLAIEDELAVQLVALRLADKAQTRTGNSDLDIQASLLRFCDHSFPPADELAGYWIAYMIQVCRGEIGVFQHQADTVCVASSKSSDGRFISVPGARVVRFGRCLWMPALIR